jgi:transcription-repair coupling factor (superfamily II helicase)
MRDAADALRPFRIRQLVAHLSPGERIAREKLAALLQANGYSRVDTVRDRGNMPCAAASSISSRRARPRRSGSISSATRSRACAASIPQPSGQRERRGHHPSSPPPETLLDEDSVKRFRSRYASCSARPRPAIRSTRRCRKGGAAGVDHWRPCSRSGWDLFDISRDIIVRDAGTPAPPRRVRAVETITRTGPAPVHRAGSYRPLSQAALFRSEEWER